MKAFWTTAIALLLAAAAPAVGHAQETAEPTAGEADTAEQPSAGEGEARPDDRRAATGQGDDSAAAETGGESDRASAGDGDGPGDGGEETGGDEAAGDAEASGDGDTEASGDGDAEASGDGDAEASGNGDTEASGDGETEGDAEAEGDGESEVQKDFGTATVAEGGTFWMPPQASTVAEEVDWLFYAITALSIFCFIGITVALVYFVIRYRARDGHRAEASPSHNDAMEITWTVLPSIIVVIIFVLGWQGYMKLAATPQHAEEIRVTAQKWNWNFSYSNGYSDSTLHVPANQPVRLVMRSEDVLHSLFIPAFRVKMDVIPNRYSRLWFEANEPGTYRLYCTEYCGEDHANMKTKVVVHPPGEYEDYLEEARQAQLDLPPLELGELLYEMQGCNQCHSIDGSDGKGPTFKGIWGAEHTLEDGSTVTVEDNYIRQSLLDPQSEVRAGYNPIMPTFAGKLSDREIDGIIAFIKSLE